jgi:hypothetical protein
MSFINPFFLYFLPLASVPVILHLLNKSRFKKVEFSSIQFLSALESDVIKKLKLKQLILLIIRTLIILLLILAFARPVVTTTQSGTNIKQGQTVYLLVDNSFSMSKSKKGRPLLDRQIDKILNLLEDSAYPFTLKLLTTTAPGQFKFRDLVKKHEKIKNILKDLETVSDKGRMTSALQTIQADVEDNQTVSPAVWILSDFQVAGQEMTRSLEAGLKNLNNCRILLFPIAYGEENYSIVGASFPDQIVEINNEINVSGLVDSEGQAGEVPISLFLEGERAGRTTLDFKNSRENTTEFEFIPTSPGVLNGKLALPADKFMQDNDHYFSIHIPEKLRVLITGRNQQEKEYLIKAARIRGANKFETKFVSRDAFATEDLFNYDVIILSELTGINTNLLNTFLERGGGLLVLPDQDERLAEYNKMAGKLTLPRWDRVQKMTGNNFIKLGNIEDEHPIFRDIWQGKKVLEPEFYQIPVFKVNGQKVIASYENGAPFLMVSGNSSNIILMATNPSEKWTDIQFTGLFAPLIHRVLSYLGGQTQFNFSYTTGDTIQLSRFNLENTQDITISTPSDKEYLPEINGGEKIFRKTLETGIYNIYYKNRKKTSFAVNVSEAEKKLQYLSAKELQNIDSLNYIQMYDENKQVEQTTTGEVSHWLILMVLLMAAGESWLARSE